MTSKQQRGVKLIESYGLRKCKWFLLREMRDNNGESDRTRTRAALFVTETKGFPSAKCCCIVVRLQIQALAAQLRMQRFVFSGSHDVPQSSTSISPSIEEAIRSLTLWSEHVPRFQTAPELEDCRSSRSSTANPFNASVIALRSSGLPKWSWLKTRSLSDMARCAA